VRATYDKFHLVPFGEYVPFQKVLRLAKLVHGRGSFSPGSGPVTLDLPGLPPVSPLICYEIIFPHRVTAPDGPRPRWLLNLTNDAWFGASSGPYQHLVAARLRAVEEGLPVVRAANTGISAVVDAYGRVRAGLGLNRTGTVDHGLPQALDSSTIYGWFGNWVTLGLVCVVAGMAVFVGSRDRRRR
jgi:apolipoprotein N-acyltransferase